MAIKVTCKCGRSLTAPNEAAGKQGKCPACGNRLLIVASEEPVLLTEVTEEMPLGFSLDLGQVTCTYSKWRFTFHLVKNRCAYIEVIAYCDHGDGEDSSIVVMRLDDERYEQLVRSIKATEEVVSRYRKAGLVRRMVEVFGHRP
jgi:hypothetical protein